MKQFKKLCGMLFTLAAMAVLGLSNASVAEAAEATYFHAYEKFDYETISDRYELTVNGTPVDVVTYYNGRYDYAHIAYEGTTTFQVKSLKGDIVEYNVSPHSYNLDVTVSGDTLTFDMTQKGSRYVLVEVTIGGKVQQLFISADPKLDIEKPDLTAENVVNIMDCGIQMPYADADGKTNSAIIQAAIDELSAAGGGTLYFPAGTYKYVTIDAKSNVTLFLDEGAVLRGSGKRTDYGWADSGQNGRQVVRKDILIDDCENFAIIGYGMIDANAIPLALKRNLIKAPEVDDREQPDDYYPDGWDDFRKGIVDAHNANGITFKGVAFKDATGWTFNIQTSNNIKVTNVKIIDDWDVVHSDGYDFCSCRDVTVSDCLGICGDDVYCPKAEYAGSDTAKMTFKDSVAYALGGAGCKVGVAARSDARDIEFNNIDVIQGYRGFSLSHDEGQGKWEDIRFIDVRTERLHIANRNDTGQYRSAPFIIWTLSAKGGTGTIDNVLVKNCYIEDCGGLKGIVREHSADGHISNVTFDNFKMDGVKITTANYADYITQGANVSNIMYDEEPNVKTDSYEAEDAERTAGTKIDANKANASGHTTVTNVGLMNAGTADASVESVTFTVPSDVATTNKLTIYYLLSGSRDIDVYVNDVLIVEEGKEHSVACNGNNWHNVYTATLDIPLKAGDNTIKLTNDKAACPNIDRITVTHTHTQEEGWSIDENNHWKVYTCGHNYTTAAEAHVDADGNMLCDVCSYDMEVPSAEDILIDVYEAEDALNVGTQINNKNNASGGKAVYNVGLMNGGNVTSVTFTVSSEEATTRNMTIFYAVNGTRTFYVTVNDGVPQAVICQGGSWDDFTSTTVPVVLQEGENTIVLTNPNAAAPNLDKIEISHVHKYNKKWESDATSHWRTAYCGHDDIKKDLAGHYNADGDNKCDVCGYEIGDVEIPLPGPTGDERTTYEAEDAVHSDATLAPTAKNWASGGYTMGNVGLMDAGTVNSLTFTVPSDVAGKHTLTLRYVSNDNKGVRTTTFIVNGTEVATLDCSGNGWDNPKEISLEVDLVAGNNTIVLTNETGAAPNMDCIYIVHTHAYAEEWSANADIHWHAATCGHDYKADAALHVDEDGNDICDVCEYNMGEVEPPVSGGDAEPPVSGGDAEPPVSGGDAEPPVSGGDAEPPVSGGDAEPTPAPTEEPTAAPTEAPTAAPTEAPTAAPTEAPTAAPTEAPTAAPTEAPSTPDADDNKPAPTAAPTEEPKATSPKTYDDSEIEDAVIGIGAETALDAVNASNNVLWILAVVLMGALVTAIAVWGHAYLKKEDGEDL